MKAQDKMEKQIHHMLKNVIIVNRAYLDDEQLDRSEQSEVLTEIFDADVRDRELTELSSHFAPIFRNDHPIHLSVLGKTGTGKTVTILYFLNMLKKLCEKRNIALTHLHLDLSTPVPCFRALNDLACFLDAARRYKKGISLDELMSRIEDKLKSRGGYLVLFMDEIDHIRTDLDSFLKFVIRRLPQRITTKLVLVFTSNKLNWQENMDPRVKSFLKSNEILFEPYNALDLKKILSIRIRKALNPKVIREGVVEKISAISSRTHGDARKAVELLSKSAHIAQREGTFVTTETVDMAFDEIERDKYVAMTKSAPRQLQAALFSLLSLASHESKPIGISDSYEYYLLFCGKVRLRPLTQRAFSDLVSELDIYGFIHVRIISHGRHGRGRQIAVNLPEKVADKLRKVVLMAFDLHH
jgi:cell division control protein 6